MKKLIIILVVVVAVLCAARPLICWKIGLDMKWHKAYCWSNEFSVDKSVLEKPTNTPTEWIWTPPPTYTPEEESTPTPTDEVVPYPVVTQTQKPPYPNN